MKLRSTRAQRIGWFVLLTALTVLAWVRVVGGCPAPACAAPPRAAGVVLQ